MRQITLIIIHCSAEETRRDVADIVAEWQSVDVTD